MDNIASPAFHRWTSTLLAATFLLAPACVKTLVAQAMDFDVVRVTDRVYAFVPSERGAGNSVAIFGDDGVLVVDATLTPSGALAVIDEIQKHTSLPVRTLVLTHWHDDHIWGTQELRSAYPAVDIVAHAHTRQDMLQIAIPGLKQNIANLEARINERDLMLQRGTEREGQPISEERRQALEKRQAAFRDLLVQLDGIEPVLPTTVLEESLVIYLGRLEVNILHLGRGHTSGDLVVYVPSEAVLITGDLLTQPFPAAAGAFVIDWIDTLKRLALLDAAVIVPGHGPLLRDEAYLNLVSILLESVVAQVRKAHERGLSVEAAVEAVDVDELRDRMAGGDEPGRRAFQRFFLRPAVESVYQQLNFSSARPTPMPRPNSSQQ